MEAERIDKEIEQKIEQAQEYVEKARDLLFEAKLLCRKANYCEEYLQKLYDASCKFYGKFLRLLND